MENMNSDGYAFNDVKLSERKSPMDGAADVRPDQESTTDLSTELQPSTFDDIVANKIISYLNNLIMIVFAITLCCQLVRWF